MRLKNAVRAQGWRSAILVSTTSAATLVGATSTATQHAFFSVTVEASSGPTDPLGSLWKVEIDSDGRASVEISTPRGKLSGTFDFGEQYIAEVRNVIASEQFLDLSSSITASRSIQHATDLRIEVTINDEVHSVSLYNPREAKHDDEAQRFLRVWEVVFKRFPIRPSW